MDPIRFQCVHAAISIIGFVIITVLAFLAAKFGTEWAKAMMDTILPLIVGCWITNFTTVVNFFFGSSSSSAENRAIVKQLTSVVDLTNEVKK
jgi:energy-coupling factor transporter transmembrane protein EcfT